MSVRLAYPVACTECGFTSVDVELVAAHSCVVTLNGGRCEDFPCCGHEAGDCNGELYGSSAAIWENPHVMCDHETGYCEVDFDDE